MSAAEYVAWMTHAATHPLAAQVRSGLLKGLSGRKKMLRGQEMLAALNAMGGPDGGESPQP